MTAIISCRNVDKRYGGGTPATRTCVLRDYSLEIDAGEFVALTGASGSGKTTLLNLIGGLDQPDTGEVIVAGTALQQLSNRALARWRSAHIGIVFQSHNLISVLTAAENVELPLLLKPMSPADRLRRVKDALAHVGLTDRAAHRPAQLSGGQQQRVGIARAVIADPPILLCDEPTGSLDPVAAEEVLRLLDGLHQRGKTIVMVTHDGNARSRATRQIVLSASIS